MGNPVLVEVLRGDLVESRHRGSVAIVDGDGKLLFSAGDIAAPVFPRSAIKAIQALPFVESGAADAFGFGNRELALACASHSSEPDHADLATTMLARAGLTPDDLECGAHWPFRQDVALALARKGEPGPAHNNCSGKHAGFLCTCRHLGIDHRGYVSHGHAAQEAVRDAMEAVTGATHGVDVCGTDGCSIPTYAVPLQNLALGFARMATGNTLGQARAQAAKRLFAACMAEPFFVAGTDRADTAMMKAGTGRIFTKTGAEGVFCAALPELGLGIALKCDDGATRAAEVMVATVLARLLGEADPAAERLSSLAQPVLKNWRGLEVGRLRPTPAFDGVAA